LFTPNGDGVNDIFLVYSPKTITEFDMIITNRAGVVLFRSKDINIGWDGANASQDIYFYVIIFKDSYDRKQIRKGIINLIR
jgi:gliding motility-associated-like protein